MVILTFNFLTKNDNNFDSALFQDPTLYPHELHHLWQSRAFGDMFLPNYILQGLEAKMIGGSFLEEYNYFEDQAYGSYWW